MSFVRPSNEIMSSSASLPSTSFIQPSSEAMSLPGAVDTLSTAVLDTSLLLCYTHLIVEKVAGIPAVFTSPLATGLPWLFDYNYTPPPEYRGFLKTMLRPHWEHHNVHPSLAFTPLDIPYEGPIFGRLKFNTKDGHPPLTPHGILFATGYSLSSEYVRKWSRLEVAFDVIVYLLCKRPECRAGWSTGACFQNLPRPRWFGYDRIHHTKADAERAAYRSRQAFHALAGMCSYTIALCSGYPDLPNPEWVSHLGHWVHPGWLEDLRSSVVGTLNETVWRRGALIDANRCRWDDAILRAMVASSVPVWFLWKSPADVKSNYCNRFKPDPKQVLAKLRLLDVIDSSTAQLSDDIVDSIESQVTGSSSFTSHTTTNSAVTADTAPTTVDLDLDPPFPPVEKGSRQRRGQDWRSFFEDQDRRHAGLYRNATENQLQIWATMRRDNEYGPAPGRRGAVVWEWEDVDGFFIRKRVERGRVESVFYLYSRSQKRYNPIEREWDLHYEFDLTAVPDDDDDDETIYNEGPPVAVEETNIAQTFRDDMEGSYGSIEEPLRAVNLQNASLPDILRQRYGLVVTVSSKNIPVPSNFQLLSDDELKNILLRTDVPRAEHDERTVRVMSLFIKLVSRGLFAAPEAPSVLRMWDLSENNGNPLTMNESPPFYRVWGTDRRKINLFVVSGCDDSDAKWDMLLESPVTLLECRRRFHSGTSKRDIILHLIRTGTPFIRVIDLTNFNPDTFSVPRSLPPDLLPGWRRAPFIADNEKNSLGCRWPDYKPNHADYISYWAKLVTFLRGPRGHLAVMMGGIVWRLAVQALGLEEIGRIVLSGSAYRSPGSIRYESRIHSNHFDELETLSLPELDFIVGTYYVYTDKGVQTAKRSWWPPHHTWHRNGRDMGQWTQVAEEWFRGRLDTIRKDPADALRTPKVWNNSLKYEAKALRQFVNGSNEAAAEFLFKGPFRVQ